MLLSRRQIIEAGAATGALAALSSPLLAAVIDPPGRDRLADLRIDEVDPPAPRRGPPSPSIRSSIRASSPAPAPRSTATAPRSAISTSSASPISPRRRREPRFYLLDTNSGRVTRHLVAHGRGSDPAPYRLPAAFLQPARLGGELERRLCDQRILSGPLRPLDAGARARLQQQQCRGAGDRRPLRLVCRAQRARAAMAASAAARAASRFPTPASRKCSRASGPAASSTPTGSPKPSAASSAARPARAA